MATKQNDDATWPNERKARRAPELDNKYFECWVAPPPAGTDLEAAEEKAMSAVVDLAIDAWENGFRPKQSMTGSAEAPRKRRRKPTRKSVTSPDSETVK